jgi:DNA-binding MarR family transcriptional regulator
VEAHQDTNHPTAAPAPDDLTAGPAPDLVAAAGQVLYGLATESVRRMPRDMSLTTMATLSTLDRTGPRRITDLALIQGVAQPSMTTLVTTLQRAGLAERHGDPEDRRVALVEITPAGSELLRARRRAGAEAIAELIAKLPPGEVAALTAAIPALEHLRELGHERRDPAEQPPGPAAPQPAAAPQPEDPPK